MKTTSTIEFQNAALTAGPPSHIPPPDVASAAGPASGSSGIVTVPNCSGANRPTSILKASSQNSSDNSGLGFNSSCQQCIAERAAVGGPGHGGVGGGHHGINTVSK